LGPRVIPLVLHVTVLSIRILVPVGILFRLFLDAAVVLEDLLLRAARHGRVHSRHEIDLRLLAGRLDHLGQAHHGAGTVEILAVVLAGEGEDDGVGGAVAGVAPVVQKGILGSFLFEEVLGSLTAPVVECERDTPRRPGCRQRTCLAQAFGYLPSG
jgi:hypothetical protein